MGLLSKGTLLPTPKGLYHLWGLANSGRDSPSLRPQRSKHQNKNTKEERENQHVETLGCLRASGKSPREGRREWTFSERLKEITYQSVARRQVRRSIEKTQRSRVVTV